MPRTFPPQKRNSLHPHLRSHADKKVAARDMARDWQPDFEKLVDDHQSMVFSLALRMTGDRGLAEEIAQDVFLELDRHLARIESPAHALNWLRRVAMSRSADALRRRKVRCMDLWVEIEEGHGAQAEQKPSAMGSRIESLLATLPEPQRAALILRYQEDLTPEEIAAITQRTAGHGQESPAARAQAAAGQGNKPSQGVHPWSLIAREPRIRRTTLNRNWPRHFARRPAPPSLKRKIMARRSRQNTERIRNRTAILAASRRMPCPVRGPRLADSPGATAKSSARAKKPVNRYSPHYASPTTLSIKSRPNSRLTTVTGSNKESST